LKLDEKTLSILFDQLFEGIYFVDTERNIAIWNKAAEELTGFTHDEIIGHRCMDNLLVHVDSEGRNLCTGSCPLLQAINEKREKETSIYLHHKNGHRIPVSVRIVPLTNDSGEVTGAIEIFAPSNPKNDLEERVQELEKLSMLDPLTGIANRRYGEKIIIDRIEEKKRFNWDSGIIFFDIDDFKSINDNYSHYTGDKMLKMIANTFRESIRGFDNVARWGGEEFIVVLSNINHDQLKDKSEILRKLINESFFIEEGKRFSATISGGATMLDEKDTVISAVNRADKLMYKSKKNGKNQITLD
jgi:diguanylate cyclase (GGDEF)-like protein/PAS domain S-box-containing protein